MATSLSLAVFATILVAALFQNSAAQTTHTVGGASGWIIPPGGPSFYTTWAANSTFIDGDILVFNFASGQHDVTKVTKANYDSCSSTSPISQVSSSPARITINSTGPHYFICGFPGHCSAGQKLMINVSAATTSAPAPAPSSPAPQASTPTPVPAAAPTPVSTPPASSPAPTSAPPASSPNTATPPAAASTPSDSPPLPTTPSPAGTTAPPPSDNSAKSLGVAGLSATFLSIFVAFLY